MSREPIAFIGAGMVGTALAFLLNQHGHPITGIYSRSRQSSERMCNFIGTGKIYENPADAARTADVVFLTTPDDRIRQVCREIVEEEGFLEGAIALHCSGALPSSVLEGARDSKVHIGSMHPLQSFASLTEAVQNLRGITWAIEGDKRAQDLMIRFTELLGGKAEVLSLEDKTLYHIGAVLASNYLVTLKDLAVDLLVKSGLPRETARQGLQTLMQGTLNNLKSIPASKALTGPIARGDVSTIESHLETLRAQVPQLLELYKVLGQHTVALNLKNEQENDEKNGLLIKLFSDQ